ncbi:UNVERIFIED_CONTAM: hypothetical protein Slati_2759500 [Sesamum latifolium]|uniref:Reverse transcriptase zinc-binding domain-containing protein n=1 Tax=Sesamum latifolium TaxID=2727402 RepID=A0AAW2W1U3_9LAMI
MIREELSAKDADCILSIPLSDNQTGGKIVWYFGKNDCFTVRNAYESAVRRSYQASTSTDRTDWRYVWYSKIPPKVKLFVWRCSHEALPTLMNLKSTGLSLETKCSWCAGEQEDITHVLLKCPFACLVWALTSVRTVTLPQEVDRGTG